MTIITHHRFLPELLSPNPAAVAQSHAWKPLLQRDLCLLCALAIRSQVLYDSMLVCHISFLRYNTFPVLYYTILYILPLYYDIILYHKFCCVLLD